MRQHVTAVIRRAACWQITLPLLLITQSVSASVHARMCSYVCVCVCVCHTADAYGAEGLQSKVPPNANIEVDLKLLQIKKVCAIGLCLHASWVCA